MSNDSPSSNADQDIGLTDVILAMDVVDTLRHEQQLVRHALNADAREDALIERVRSAYEQQGIEVSEAMIVEGVEALKARQYVYEPPPPGLKTTLLKGWVNRRRISGGLAVVGVLASIIGAGWVGFVEWPAQRALVAEANSLNQGISVASAELTELQQQRARLAKALDTRAQRAGNDAIFASTIASGRRGLEDAEAALLTAATLEQLPVIDSENFASRETEADSLLLRQNQALDDARTALNDVQSAIQLLDDLTDLPERLATLRDQAQALAVEPETDTRIASIFTGAMSALRQGDAAQATAAADELADIVSRLNQVYEIRVVSRPGVLSGVIRAPERNSRANNYYLVVEALDSNNRAVAVDIRSEEDGTTRSVRLWGVRVPEAEFERIRRDKADDGVIQQSLVGNKPRGYLDIDYAIDTEGGFINRWVGLR